MQPVEPSSAPDNRPIAHTPDQGQGAKLNKVKLGFLYVLVGGLIVSALISVIALLIGEFNSVMQKALLTTLTLVLHSCIALLIILTDSQNRLGRALVATTIVTAVIANGITTSLGIWEVVTYETAARIFCVYMLLIGTAFIVSGVRRLRIAQRTVRVLVDATVILAIILAVSLIPWIVAPYSVIVTEFYYRLVGVFAILATTSFVITCIFNRIYVAQHPALSATVPVSPKYSSGLLAIVITVGVIVALFWAYGLGSFIESATYRPQYYDNSQYNGYNDSYNSYDSPYNQQSY